MKKRPNVSSPKTLGTVLWSPILVLRLGTYIPVREQKKSIIAVRAHNPCTDHLRVSSQGLESGGNITRYYYPLEKVHEATGQCLYNGSVTERVWVGV